MARTRVRRKGEGGVYLRGDKWWVKYYPQSGGEPEREPTGKDPECGPPAYKNEEKKAWAYLNNVMKKVASAQVTGTTFVGAKQQRATVGELLDAYLNKKKADALSERREVSKPFLCDWGRAKLHFGDVKALTMTNAWWSKWKVNEAEELINDEEYSPTTLNRWMEMIRSALRYGKKEKMISEIPCDFEGVMYDESGNARKGFFEYEEFEALLTALADEDLKDYCMFGYLVGWRSGSIKSLKWSTIDLKAGTIELPSLNEKSRVKNLMPIGEKGDALYELIQRRLARRAFKHENGMDALAEYVFHRQGDPIGDIRKTWDTACAAANLGNKLFHDFRRTAARNIYIATGNKDLAKSITGHRTDAIFDRYNIIVNEQKTGAIRQTLAHLAKQGHDCHVIVPIGHKLGTKRSVKEARSAG